MRIFPALMMIVLAALAVPFPVAARTARSAEFAALQAEDEHLQQIGWRLATANAPYCDNARKAIGLLLQDVMNYRDPAAARKGTGLTGDIGVQAVVPGSPAAQAGLEANDEVIAIDGRPMAALPAVKAGNYARLVELHDAVDAALDRDGTVKIAWRRDGQSHEAVIAGVPVCPSRFELVTGGVKADADGKRARISQKVAAMTVGEDELAALVAHELAHNVLEHKLHLREVGRTWGNIKSTEREADRLSVWLLGNAGYDIAASPRMLARIGKRFDYGIFATPDHPKWKTRIGDVNAEIAAIEAARTRTGSKLVDFRPRFARQSAN